MRCAEILIMEPSQMPGACLYNEDITQLNNANDAREEVFRKTKAFEQFIILG